MCQEGGTLSLNDFYKLPQNMTHGPWVIFWGNLLKSFIIY